MVEVGRIKATRDLAFDHRYLGCLVNRLEKFFGQEWRALGIYDAVRLSTIEIAMDKELLIAALSFWCSATNTMILPLGPMGPTILDVSTILGTSPTGLSVDAALVGLSSNLDLKALFDARVIETLSRDGREPSKDEVQKLHKNFFNYNTLIVHFAGRGEASLRKGEHEAFLFYWYNKFICCTKSNKCLVENMPVAEALASGHSLSLSSAVLAHLLRFLADATTEKIDPHQSGPLWFFSFGCRRISLQFDRKVLTSHRPKPSVSNWLLDQCLHTELKKCSNSFSALRTSPTMSF